MKLILFSIEMLYLADFFYTHIFLYIKECINKAADLTWQASILIQHTFPVFIKCRENVGL